MVEVAASRQAQEVQAMMVVAKRFPRDETKSVAAIVKSCQRKGLAECAIYSYPRGNKRVTGPSIRLAETMARCWGNLDFGILELEQRPGESDVMAYAWDMETNVRQTKVFTVRHWRDTQEGGYALHDSRDIYELTANMGARRVRACILGVIPGDIQDEAVAACEKTLAGKSTEPLEDRVRKMVVRFAEMGVTLEMIEAKLQHPIGACDVHTLVNLGTIFNSIKDGLGKREEFFDIPSTTTSKKPGSKTQQMADDVAKKPKPKQKQRKPPEQPTPKPEVAAPNPEPKPFLADIPPELEVYAARLESAETEGAVRDAWSEEVFDHKDILSPANYGIGCQLRDQHIKRVAAPKQGKLL